MHAKYNDRVIAGVKRGKSMRQIILIFLLLFNGAVLSCAQPRSGSQFDELINIVGPNSEGVYELSVPVKLEGYKQVPIIELSYTKFYENGYRIAELTKPLILEAKNGFLVSSFSIKKIAGYKVYIHVFWPPNRGGMCGVSANSKLLSAK